MNLLTRHELEITRQKLARLEEKLTELQSQRAADKDVHALEIQTLHKWINRFKEEIARFEAHAASTA